MNSNDDTQMGDTFTVADIPVDESQEVQEIQGVQENEADTIPTEPDAPELSLDDMGIEIARWTCTNHENLEMEVPIYPPDTAVLLKMADDSMMLVYSLGGDGHSRCVVNSLEEAEELICEDNESTQELYPGKLEALWNRV